MNKKALVIEDDKNIAELLRLYLEKDGFEVSIASDGGQGLRLAGDPFTSMLIVAGTPQGRVRFDEAWFPVEEVVKTPGQAEEVP